MRNTLLALSLLSLTACTAQDAATLNGVSETPSVDTPVILTPVNPCDSSSQPFGGGSGTAADPYLVCSTAQLKSLAMGAYTYTHAKLMAGITLAATNGAATAGLGDFYGTLDGNGQIIGGLKTTSSQGLFDHLYGTVKNLELTYMTVTCGTSGCGALAGILETGGVVDNVVVHDSSVAGTQAIGGVIGTVYGSATQVYSWTTSVNASSYSSGGLAGQVEAGGVLSGNSASGTYSASLDHGFVVGTLQGAVTCLAGSGHSWASAHSIGFTSGGSATGCL